MNPMTSYILIMGGVIILTVLYMVCYYLNVQKKLKEEHKQAIGGQMAFNLYIIGEANRIVNDYQRRKKIFRSVRKEEEDE